MLAEFGHERQSAMDETEILARLTQIVRDTLDDDGVTLARSTEASDVDNWDSVAHVRIMIAVEESFGIRFETDELSDMPNVGALIDRVAAKSLAK
jgi:acyl carrier protein